MVHDRTDNPSPRSARNGSPIDTSSGDSWKWKIMLNPLMLNVFSHPYQMDESITILGLLGGIFHFYSNFKRNFCLQIVENLIRCRILRHLIWFCTDC